MAPPDPADQPASPPGAARLDRVAAPSHPRSPLAPTGIAPESDVRTHSPGAASPHGEHPYGQSEGLGELPEGYADGRLVCLVRDPTCAFVYWDLSRSQIESAFGGLGRSRAALKLQSLKGELLREVEVHLPARGWYLRELAPGSEFRVELWALGESGTRLLRTARAVRLPPAGPSDQLDDHYLHLPMDRPLPGVPLIGGRPRLRAQPAPLPGWDGGPEAERILAGHRPGQPRSGQLFGGSSSFVPEEEQ
jgi:hypothetical protein